MGNSCSSNNNVKIEQEQTAAPTKKAGVEDPPAKVQKPTNDEAVKSKPKKEDSPVASTSKKHVETVQQPKNSDIQEAATNLKRKEKEGTVKIVITEAVTEPVPETEETFAEILVTDILAAAQQKAKDKRAAHKKALETMPPFQARKLIHRLNKFQQKIEDLLDDDGDDDKEIPIATGISDPITFIHDISQKSINESTKKPQTRNKDQPLLLISKKEKKEARKMMAAIVDKATLEKDAMTSFKNPMAPTPKPPSIPAEFMQKILETHAKSVEKLKPIYDLMAIHIICQKHINDRESSAKPAILVSPAVARETGEAIQSFLKDPKNHQEKSPDQNPQKSAPPTIPAELMEKIMKTHDASQKQFVAPPPMEQIHKVCQQSIDNDEVGFWSPIFVTRSDREEAKSLLTNLVNFEIKLRQNDEKQLDKKPIQITPPEALIQGVWRSHQLAMACFLGEDGGAVEDDNGDKKINMEIFGQNIIQIHQASQFSLHGVQPPVTSPAPISKDVAMETGKNLKELAPRAFLDTPAKKHVVDMSPMPPHIFRQLFADLKRIHLLAQESLGAFSRQNETKIGSGGGGAGVSFAKKVETPSPIFQSKYEETNESDYASLESFKILHSGPSPGKKEDQGHLQPVESEPLYAKVNKRPLTPMVSFDDSPKNFRDDDQDDDDVDGEAIRMSLQKRKPTGVFLGQNKIKLRDSHSTLDRTVEEESSSSSGSGEDEKKEEVFKIGKKPLVKRDTWVKHVNGSDDRVRPIEVQDKNVVPPTRTRKAVGSLVAAFEQQKLS